MAYKNFKRIGIFIKQGQENAINIGVNIAKWLLKKDIEVLAEDEVSSKLNLSKYTRLEIAKRCDIAFVLGGDGTFLSVARLIIDRDIPLMGINLGSLGFLTEITLEEIYSTLEAIFTGKCIIDKRMMLKAEIFRNNKKLNEYTVLNDVVINKGALARIINIETSINNKYLTTYRADGLIIATPTGSTAYSLSAGGPILYPDLNSIIITPICPHTLTHRPIVVSGDDIVEVKVNSHDSDVLATLDGQIGIPVKNEDLIKIQKSPKKTYILKHPKKDYFELLRNKLKWGIF